MLLRLLLLVILMGEAQVLLAQADSCGACHAPELADRSCVRCHEKKTFAGFAAPQGLYVQAPPFQDLKLRQRRAFDPEGLKLFLQRPAPRRRHHGSMPVFTAKEAETIVRRWAAWTAPSTYLAEERLIPQGRSLFAARGCLHCHGELGRAPRLPLGAPLYTFGYFKNLLEGQPTYYGNAASRRNMPVFADLSQQEMRALFSYVSLSKAEVAQEIDTGLPIGKDQEALSREVRRLWQSKGCLHCHGGSADSLREIARIFGGKPEVFRLISTGKDLRIDASPEILRRDASGKNILLRALEERRLEEGSQRPNALRGMPLTMPSLRPSELRLVRLWVEKSCPQMGLYLCPGV